MSFKREIIIGTRLTDFESWLKPRVDECKLPVPRGNVSLVLGTLSWASSDTRPCTYRVRAFYKRYLTGTEHNESNSRGEIHSGLADDLNSVAGFSDRGDRASSLGLDVFEFEQELPWDPSLALVRTADVASLRCTNLGGGRLQVEVMSTSRAAFMIAYLDDLVKDIQQHWPDFVLLSRFDTATGGQQSADDQSTPLTSGDAEPAILTDEDILNRIPKRRDRDMVRMALQGVKAEVIGRSLGFPVITAKRVYNRLSELRKEVPEAKIPDFRKRRAP